MDEQPTQQAGTSPAQPVAPAAATPTAATTPTTAASTNAATSTEVEAITPTDSTLTNPTSEPGKKKSKKGLIATLICLFLVLLIGGGAFAAVYIINNQPINIIASSIDHLFNAKQVEVDGSINFSLSDSTNIGVQSVSLSFDNKAAGLSNTTSAKLNIGFPDGTSASSIELGEVMLNNGVLYIEASGLEDFYDDTFRDYLKATLMNQLVYGYQTNTVTDCYISDDDDEESANCIEDSTTAVTVNPVIEAEASKAIDEILDQVGEIISGIDGQWIEISIDDVMNSDMLATIPSNTRQTISDTYKCTVNVLNQMPNYSGEFSDLYNQNPFVNMTSGQDSFYKISFDSTNLAGFLNGTANTQFAKDLAKCSGVTTETTTTSIKAEDIEEGLQYLPSISAKFDGFINHYLSELKVSSENDSYSLSSDLKFSYPENLNITTPSDSRPVMEVIEEVYQKLENISKSMLSAS